MLSLEPTRLQVLRQVFTADALTLLHEAAGSSLREIDRMATAALRETARRKKKLVERDVMARLVGDLGPTAADTDRGEDTTVAPAAAYFSAAGAAGQGR
jgi:hypothetical protein